MPSQPSGARRYWALLILSTIGLGALVVLALPSQAQAGASDGTFQIPLVGRISASQKGTNATGQATVTFSAQVNTIQGQYPVIMLQFDATQTKINSTRSNLVGTATLSDITGQTTLFTAQVGGYVDAQGLTHLHLAQPQAAHGSGGQLAWNSTLQSSQLGDITGVASGTLRLPTGLSASLAQSIWPGAATASTIDPTLWYLTRGAGAAAYLLLAVTSALGMGISTKAFDSVSRRRNVLDLHELLTLLMVAFIALHLVTLALDPFLSFSIPHLLWPLGETYKPLWVAMGVIGLYALAVVTLSSWLRRAMSYRSWRALHYVSAIAFVALTLHGLLAGTDSATPWMLGIYVASTLTIVALTGLRLVQALGRAKPKAAQVGRG